MNLFNKLKWNQGFEIHMPTLRLDESLPAGEDRAWGEIESARELGHGSKAAIAAADIAALGDGPVRIMPLADVR